MVVRVRIRIRYGERCIETIALVNSGYEASEPEITIPVSVAEELGLWPPKDFILGEAVTAGGEITVYVMPDKAFVKLAYNDVSADEVPCRIVINKFVDETLLSDHAIDALGIVVLSFGKGLWRHERDPADKVRSSEKR